MFITARRWWLLFPILLLLANRAESADSNFSGTWRLTALQPDRELVLGLIAIETRGGTVQARVIAASMMEPRDILVQRVSAKGNQLRVDLEVNQQTARLAAYAVRDEGRPARLLGSLEIRGRRDLVRLDKTEARDLDPSKISTPSPALDDMTKAMAQPAAKDREAALRKILDRSATQAGVALPVALELLELALETAPTEAELKARAEQAIKIAALHGREMEMQVGQITAQTLLRGGKEPALALTLVKQAEKLLDKQDSLATQARILRTLIHAHRAANDLTDLPALEARLAPIDKQLDDEYEKNLVPFPVNKHSRPANSNRVVVLELFTGTQRPPSAAADPSVTADVVFAALKATYGPRDVVLLQHHLHIPESNPLANPDTEQRALSYGINFTPAVFLNGRPQPNLGGSPLEARGDYATLREAINKQLAGSSPIELSLSASRAQNQVRIQAQAKGLPEGEPKHRLVVMLVEDRVRYVGTNGDRLHDHVVRAIPKLPDEAVHGGKPLDLTLDLAALRKKLTAYLDDTAKSDPFPDEDRPLELANLHVVVLVQNDKTREIVQAAMAPVPNK